MEAEDKSRKLFISKGPWKQELTADDLYVMVESETYLCMSHESGRHRYLFTWSIVVDTTQT